MIKSSIVNCAATLDGSCSLGTGNSLPRALKTFPAAAGYPRLLGFSRPLDLKLSSATQGCSQGTRCQWLSRTRRTRGSPLEPGKSERTREETGTSSASASPCEAHGTQMLSLPSGLHPCPTDF